MSKTQAKNAKASVKIGRVTVRCSHDEIRSIDELTPHPQNPNSHPTRQVELLAKVIEQNGWRSPIVISTRSGFVVKGHGRLLAAKRLKMKRVPIDLQDYDSDELELADVVADNRLAELSEFDRSALKEIMESLDSGAIDSDLTGFDLDKIESLMTAAPPENPIAMPKVELVNILDLHPHPENYLDHPEDQIEEIIASIKANGLYRNIVVGKHNTILAGHGVWIAAQKMGVEKIPVVRVELEPDSPLAIKILTGDNEISKRGMTNDRALSELLKRILDSDEELSGTGFDEMMLANLVLVTRPQSEIEDFDAAAEWVGMPEYDEQVPEVTEQVRVLVRFPDFKARDKFAELIGQELPAKQRVTTIDFPKKKNDDVKSVRVEG